MFKIITNSERETMHLGKILGSILQPGDFIALNGELGAGKTCLARGIGAGLGTTSKVKSPTFALINEYEGKIPLYHMDTYRLESPEEIEDLGYEDFFFGPGATMVEWADNIKPYLPGQRLDIYIKKKPGDDNARIIEIVPHGAHYKQLAWELMKIVRAGD